MSKGVLLRYKSIVRRGGGGLRKCNTFSFKTARVRRRVENDLCVCVTSCAKAPEPGAKVKQTGQTRIVCGAKSGSRCSGGFAFTSSAGASQKLDDKRCE